MQRDWRQNWVVHPIPSTGKMQALAKTVKIVLFKVEAPLGVRIKRAGEAKIDLDSFIKLTEDYE